MKPPSINKLLGATIWTHTHISNLSKPPPPTIRPLELSDMVATMPRTVDITLRPFELSDVDDFLVWAGDDRVTRFCRWDTYTSREEAATFVEEMIRSHPWYRAICADGRPVGSIYVMPGTGKDGRRGEIGYALSSDWWGRGVATAAVKMAVEAAGKELKYVDRIEGLVFKENVASQRVLEKAGFVKDGVLKKYFHVKGQSIDIVVFSMLMNHN